MSQTIFCEGMLCRRHWFPHSRSMSQQSEVEGQDISSELHVLKTTEANLI